MKNTSQDSFLSKILDGTQASGFSLEKLGELTSFKARKEYCNEHLETLGTGSSRRVYDLGDGNVIKLAINSKGYAQNENESEPFVVNTYSILNQSNLELSDDDDRWVVAPKLERITKQELSEFLGASTKELEIYFGKLNHAMLYNGDFPKEPSNVTENFDALHNLIYDVDFNACDFGKADSFGKDSNGNIKVIDYGYTNSVFKEHYSAPKMKFR